MKRKKTNSLKEASRILQKENFVEILSSRNLTVGGITYPKDTIHTYTARNVDKINIGDFILAVSEGKLYDAVKVVNLSSGKFEFDFLGEIKTVDKIIGRLICCETKNEA